MSNDAEVEVRLEIRHDLGRVSTYTTEALWAKGTLTAAREQVI